MFTFVLNINQCVEDNQQNHIVNSLIESPSFVLEKISTTAITANNPVPKKHSYYVMAPSFRYINQDQYIYKTKYSHVYVKQVPSNTLINNSVIFNQKIGTFCNQKTLTSTIYNTFVEKDIFVEEKKTAITLDTESLSSIAKLLDQDNNIQLGSIILEAVYNEYYPSLLKLGDDLVHKYNSIQIFGLPLFLFYNEKEHKISGTISTTNNIQFVIVLDNLIYITVVINVSVREII